jgi:outer membrane protein OmpA-like peptidoglycan-associated protein
MWFIAIAMFICSTQFNPKTDIVKFTTQENFMISSKCKESSKLTPVNTVQVIPKVVQSSDTISGKSNSKVSTPVVPEKTDQESVSLKEEPVKIAENVDENTKVTVYFNFDSDRLSGSAVKELDSFISHYKIPDTIHITGFTCEIGSKSYNDNLAYRRALRVKEYLRSHNVNARMIIHWKGKCCYLSNTDLSRNRRVEITFKEPELFYNESFVRE